MLFIVIFPPRCYQSHLIFITESLSEVQLFGFLCHQYGWRFYRILVLFFVNTSYFSDNSSLKIRLMTSLKFSRVISCVSSRLSIRVSSRVSSIMFSRVSSSVSSRVSSRVSIRMSSRVSSRVSIRMSSRVSSRVSIRMSSLVNR